ncbi:MAG TPA: hypothetical protein VNH45_11215, partial [Gaiellaceae bacterium]|nr:hypothetical protein [Gaiellaceae bacterium]
MIRNRCRKSRNLIRLTGDAERLFWRLTTVADDTGRFEAAAALILTECFPWAARDPELAPLFCLDAIERWLQELVTQQLVVLYEANGERYGVFLTW